MHTREPVVLSRDSRAIQIPDGLPTILPEGSHVMITQQLGGSYTIMTEHGALHALRRIGEPARPALVATLGSDNRRSRLNAARALATFEDERSWADSVSGFSTGLK